MARTANTPRIRKPCKRCRKVTTQIVHREGVIVCPACGQTTVRNRSMKEKR